MSNETKEVVCDRYLLPATSANDSRRLSGAGIYTGADCEATSLHITTESKGDVPTSPLLTRGIEDSGEEKSDTTPVDIAGTRESLLNNESIVKDNPDIARPNASEQNYLEIASSRGEEDLSECGSASGSQSHTKDLGLREFFTSVEEANYAILDKILKCGANVTALNEERKCPLFYAIQNVDVEMTKLLLNNFAKVKSFPELLHLAASKKSIEIVEALLQHGVDVNVRGKFGNTVLHSAVSTACEAILESKSVTETDTDSRKRNASIFNEFVDMFDLLLRFNVDVNSANVEESTPLHISARNGNVEISTLLLDKGANIDAEDNEVNTPLHWAVIEGHEDVVRMLLERGADMNIYNSRDDERDRSPLHLACERGNTRIVETLLASGDCVDATTSYTETPLLIAVEKDHEEVVKLLLDRGAQVNIAAYEMFTPLHFAADNNNGRIVDALLKSGACIDAETREGDTPLHRAIYNGSEEVVELLLENGAQVHYEDFSHETPLEIATRYDNLRVMEILLRFGACVNSRKKGYRKTALHIASIAGSASAVALLLDNGADVSMKCEHSYTPFDYAWGFDRALESRSEYYQNIDRNMLREEHYTIDAFFRHQVKMEAAGLNPTASDSPVGQREGGLENFYLECQLEIARMKRSFIATNVSYFDVMKKGSKCVAKCLKNKSIVLAFESEDYKGEFPIYAGIIGFKFREALTRKKLVERATRVFKRIRGWPEDCTEKVLDFLDDDDLKVFSEI